MISPFVIYLCLVERPTVVRCLENSRGASRSGFDSCLYRQEGSHSGYCSGLLIREGHASTGSSPVPSVWDSRIAAIPTLCKSVAFGFVGSSLTHPTKTALPAF